jgi:DnaD/phage-associated family protein
MSDSHPTPQPSEEQVIIDASDLRKYRTELPNLVDDSDLDVYEYRLLGHYKRVGICREGLPTTAKKCRMSEGQASEKRQSLADKGWISLERVDMGGKRYRFVVKVIDRWIENFARYSGLSVQEITEQINKGTSPSPREGSPSRGEGSPSPREGKKELIKNNVLVVFNSGDIAKKYEQEFGALTPLIADAIADACETYNIEWVSEAMDIAVKANKRSWKYVEGILKNCKAKGVRPGLNALEKPNGNNGTSNRARTQSDRRAQTNNPPPAYSDAERQAAERVKQRNSQRLRGV